MIRPARSISFWWAGGVGTLLLSLLFLTIMFSMDFETPGDVPKVEALKLLFQFVLITMGGGLLLAYLNARRDREERAAANRLARQTRAGARCAALQELLIELGDAHRRLKVVKRQLRAQIQRDGSDAVAPPYRIRADAFERAMDALLNAQIAAEEVRDRIAIRTDLLSLEEIGRVRMALKYGARYFHDVYQDYEHCKVERSDTAYTVTAACTNLTNFLLAKRPPADLPDEEAAELESQFMIMKNDDRSLDQRHEALERIEALRHKDPGRRRYRVVATECFALAADEIRQTLRCEARFAALEDDPG